MPIRSYVVSDVVSRAWLPRIAGMDAGGRRSSCSCGLITTGSFTTMCGWPLEALGLGPVADVLVIYDAIEAEDLDATFTQLPGMTRCTSTNWSYYVVADAWAVMHQQSPVGLPWSCSPAIPTGCPAGGRLAGDPLDVVTPTPMPSPGRGP